MILGVIADDFTGASDIAAMLARGGMRTELAIGVPEGEADSRRRCGGGGAEIALDRAARGGGSSRWPPCAGCAARAHGSSSSSIARPSTRRPRATSVRSARRWRRSSACAGSSPARRCPRTAGMVFLGHLFVKGRLLSESGLEKHPLNPMTDPDIRRWLGRQTVGEVGLVDYAVVRQGPAAIRAALAAATETLVIVDAIVRRRSHRHRAGRERCAADHRRVGRRHGAARQFPRAGAARRTPAGGFRRASGPRAWCFRAAVRR